MESGGEGPAGGPATAHFPPGPPLYTRPAQASGHTLGRGSVSDAHTLGEPFQRRAAADVEGATGSGALPIVTVIHDTVLPGVSAALGPRRPSRQFPELVPCSEPASSCSKRFAPRGLTHATPQATCS